MLHQGVEINVRNKDGFVEGFWTNDKEEAKEKFLEVKEMSLKDSTIILQCSIDGIPVFHNFLDFLDMVY